MLNIVAQSTALANALNGWAQTIGGTAVVVSDLLNLWKVAYQTTDGMKCLICFVGERVRGGEEVAAALGRVDRAFVVAVIRGRGVNANRGDSLNQQVGNAAPFYQRVEEARDIIRRLQNVSVESPVDYKGIRPMEGMEEGPLDGYLIDFTVAADLPRLSAEPDNLVDPTPVFLDTIRADLPCLAEPSGGHCLCAASDANSATLQGPAGYSFDVTLHITGQVEPKVYTGGSSPVGLPWFQIGGTPAVSTFNIYRIEVARADMSTDTYYVNRSHAGEQSINNIDFEVTIGMDVGSLVTVTAISVNNDEFDNNGAGQWFQVEFVSSSTYSG